MCEAGTGGGWGCEEVMKQVDGARDLKSEATVSHQVGGEVGGGPLPQGGLSWDGTENTKGARLG